MKLRGKTKYKKPQRRKGLWYWLSRLVMVLLLLLFGVWGGVRVFGLPPSIRAKVQKELRAQGLLVRANKVYLDFFGRVKARDIYIYKSGEEQALVKPGDVIQGAIFVKKATVRFNWLSWWRGEPFLQGASISRADLMFQLDQQSAIRIEDVSTEVDVHAHKLEIKYLRGRWYNLAVDLAGTVDLEGLAEKTGGAPPNLEKLAELYRKIESATSLWIAQQPVTLSGQFQLFMATPAESEVHLQIKGEDQWVKGVRVAQTDIGVDYATHELKVKGELDFQRGKFAIDGGWVYPNKKAVLNFYTDVDLSCLAAAVPEKMASILNSTQFQQLPANEGNLTVTWEQGLAYMLVAKSHWEKFSLGAQQFDSFDCAYSYDGKRLMATGLYITSPDGDISGEFYYDGADKVQGWVDSSIDPRAFRTLFGPGAKPFFDSLDFRIPPHIRATIEGPGLKPELLVAKGQVLIDDFSYKGVAIVQASSDFDFQNHELHLAKLKVKRKEGEGGGEVWDNFQTKQVRVKGVKGTLNVQDIALILGNKMAEYMAPYVFIDTPTFQIDGRFDLNDAAGKFDTDMKASVTSEKGMHYVFMKQRLTLSNLNLNVAVKGQKLTLTTNQPLTVFDGQLSGKLDVMLLKSPTYSTQLNLKDHDFSGVMRTYFNNEKVSGQLSGDVDLHGEFNDMRSMQGSGTLQVKDGELYNIPFLGGLSELMNAIIPNLGYAKASEAESKFTVSDGLIKIEQLDIKSLSFALIGTGSYDFIKDYVDLSMRANVKGIIGVFMFPVSKLFEYQGTGPISKTKWESKVF